jgi:uncharacterized protein (DUF2147 family)
VVLKRRNLKMRKISVIFPVAAVFFLCVAAKSYTQNQVSEEQNVTSSQAKGSGKETESQQPLDKKVEDTKATDAKKAESDKKKEAKAESDKKEPKAADEFTTENVTEEDSEWGGNLWDTTQRAGERESSYSIEDRRQRGLDGIDDMKDYGD